MAKRKAKHRYDNKQTGAKNGTVLGSHASDVGGSNRFRLIAAFTISCIGLYAALNALPPSFTNPVNEHVAWTLYTVLHAFSIPVSTVNDTVSGGGLVFKIIPECTPLFTAGLFISFIVFQPASVRQKITGLTLGIPALYLGNLARLATTFMISRYDRRLFDMFHVYLGQVFSMFLVILACIVWLKWLDREKQQSIPMKAAGFLTRFALISGCLFLVWMKVHHWYIWFLDRLMLLGFSLFRYRVELACDTIVYYETFSIVITVSLILAAHSVPWRRRIPLLGAGLGLLFLIHLFHRIDNALIACFNYTAALPLDLTLLAVGQYLLPVLLLSYFIWTTKQMQFRSGRD